MTTLPIELDVERVMNLIRGFGWEMKDKVITDTEVTLTLKKEIAKE